MIPNFAMATKEHLREGVIWKELQGSAVLKTEIRDSDHVPAAITRDMYRHLNNLRIENKISLEQFLAIDDHLKKNMDHVGACERIQNTPIPFSYGLFLKNLSCCSY
jgi:putative membrane protein